jgi:glutathione reductase (NADPH)
MAYDFDLVGVGAGPGATRARRLSPGYGARSVSGSAATKPGPRGVPTAVLTAPSGDTVGLGEEEARERQGDDEILVKLVLDRASDRVRGANRVGPEAGELIRGLGVAVTSGITKARFDAMIGLHPTAAEGFVALRQPAAG